MLILLFRATAKTVRSIQKALSVFVLFLFCVSFSNQIFSQDVVIPGIYRMPDKVARDKKVNKDIKSSVRIDLHRFMGFESLPARYASLPYDTLQHTNVPGAFTDTGFILLLLLPILFLFLKRKIDPLAQLLFIAFCALFLLISIPSAFMNQHKHNTPSQSLRFIEENPQAGILGEASDLINKTTLHFYAPIHDTFPEQDKSSLIYPGMILLFLAALFLLFRQTADYTKATKSFAFFLAMYFFLWWILGVGVAWYGLLIFCVPYIFLVKGMDNWKGFNIKKFSPQIIKPSILFLSCFVWIFFAFTYRTTNYYPVNEERSKHVYIPPFVEYQAGKVTKDELFNMTFPNSIQVKKIFNQNLDARIFMVGTQAKMFAEKNDKRVFKDTFLDYFNALIQKYKNKRDFVRALRAYGFEYIVFDINLSSNDLTPTKELTRKFTNFMNCLYDNPEVELVLTDRLIRKNKTGKLVSEVFPIDGKIEKPGGTAIFKIK